MTPLQYLGRQPILTSDNDIIAYDLLYKDANQVSQFEDPRFATASVLVSVLNKFGVKNILGNKKAYIKTDDTFLMHDLIFSIPKEYFCFSLLLHETPNERNIERVEQLKERGYSVGINDANITEELLKNLEPIIDLIQFIKIDTIFSDSTSVEKLFTLAKEKNITTIATKIETHDVFEIYKKLGCDLFQGFYFSKPYIIENAVIDPNKMAVFKIYQLLLNESSIDEIVKVFEENHAITLQLLQYINSPMFSFKNNISSIQQVIMLVGRKPLSQWLLMSVYSKSINNDTKISPLMLQVKTRTELMTALTEHIDSKQVNEAYFVGVLSLISTLFSVPLPDILKQLHVSDEIKDALMYKHGLLGEVYQSVLDIEQFETQKIDQFCHRHNFTTEQFETIMAEHIHKVNELDAAFK